MHSMCQMKDLVIFFCIFSVILDTETKIQKEKNTKKKEAKSESYSDCFRKKMSPHTNAHQQQNSQQQQQPPTPQLPQTQQQLVAQQSNATNIQSHLTAQPQLYAQQSPQGGYLPQSAGIYQMMPSGVPGNVYVSNLSGNIHGYMSSTMPHNMSAYAAPFIPSEMQQPAPASSNTSLHDHVSTLLYGLDLFLYMFLFYLFNICSNLVNPL